MLRPSSLRGRLLLMVLGTSLAVWLAAAVMTWIDVRHELDELLDGHLAQAASLLVAQEVPELEDDDRVDAPVLHRYGRRVTFQVFQEGKLVLRSASAPDAPLVGDGRKPVSGFHTVDVGKRPWRVFATRGADKDVQVFVAERVSSRNDILFAVLRSTLWPMLVAMPILLLAGWWAVALGVRPLRTLGAALARRPAEDLRPLAAAGAPDEMRPLVDALNGLFERIALLLERERRFTGDAAHELRTPIAAIRAQAQVALGAGDAPQRRQALERTLAGCDRASRVVEQLLTLSKLEADAPRRSDPVDLGAVAQAVVAELAVAGIARHQNVSLSAEPHVVVEGDETLLAVLCRNLVDNALRYSPPGARIEVGVRRAGPRALLVVDDDGPGLSEPDRQRLGQRFFRAEGSEASGSGLGWSIVQRIAAVHGASVRALASPRLGGLCVEVGFPAAAEAPVRAGADAAMRK
ncbi:MAG TPA: ATP-binding protein [Ramlibacter sp.]|uniref:ATP-binding protein n=1 Tax=Ramlibacter sp. TaxID=1917967 RepID=UPI002D7EE272|nr:ATP-binding protein [Ramlibacter sp.]HET8747131.1 ATP-binding protein [Ramlibacter sp.]